jgi:RNA polymerase sigma-54 factor
MKLETLPSMEMHQKQILNPVQQQSLNILQMPLSDLQARIEEELEENPLLDTEDKIYSETDGRKYDETDAAPDSDETVKEVYIEHFDALPYSTDAGGEYIPADLVLKKETFKEYLFEQLLDIKVGEKTILLCRYIIESLDERGYLDCDTRELARVLKISDTEMERALAIVQGLQPCGVAARSLKKCLILQLRDSDVFDDNLLQIVDRHLELLAMNKIKELAKILKIDVEAAIRYCNIIKSLNPIPSRGFNTEKPEEYIIPEAYIGKNESGFYVQMNNAMIPRLCNNQAYKQMLLNEKDEATQLFLREKMNSAIAFIKAVSLRNNTLLHVIRKIVELQKDYFENGQLRPMKISDISEALCIHESTVSRAIQNKYISCRYGTIRIKSLFTSSLSTTKEGENISSNLVKKEIRDLISREDKANPLSDFDICEHLKKINVSISRRTVAKYREHMQIYSSSKRKVFT